MEYPWTAFILPIVVILGFLGGLIGMILEDLHIIKLR